MLPERGWHVQGLPDIISVTCIKQEPGFFLHFEMLLIVSIILLSICF